MSVYLIDEQSMETLPDEGKVFFRTKLGTCNTAVDVDEVKYHHKNVTAWSYTATTKEPTP